MKKTMMATPWTDPRTGMLALRRAIPRALRPAFGGKAEYKVSLRTRDLAEARAPFARENAVFETLLADARRRLAEGHLLPTPGALVRKWCEGPAVGGGLNGAQRFILTCIQLDAAVGMRMSSAAAGDIYPPGEFGVASNTDWAAVHADRGGYDQQISTFYGGDSERAGSNWIRCRWHQPESRWRHFLSAPVVRLRAFDRASAAFTDDELAVALLAVLDERRSGDDAENRARLAPRRSRATPSRRRPNLRLRQLFTEWKDGNGPRPQTALEYEAAIEDFIDFGGDTPVAAIDADALYDYRDEAAKLPATMPRADRALPFCERVTKHQDAEPKVSPSTLKKRIGALQAVLTYAFQQRWTAVNAGVGIKIQGYTKAKRTRRSFEDHELAELCASPLFTSPASWKAASSISDATIFWLFLFAITTGARLEEVGQAALADVRHDGDIAYLDIDEYAVDDDGVEKSVKTNESKRLVPVHERLLELGFLDYCAAIAALGHKQLFPDLKENSVGKRTKEASQRIARIIDRYVSKDPRLVFHSLRHAFKAKGNDAGITSRTLDQICGHAPVTSGDRYGSELRIRTVYRELHRVDFSCIDWIKIVSGVNRVGWTKLIAARG